ncbi:tetratricopeptide repeat protein [Bacteroidota bacterium]
MDVKFQHKINSAKDFEARGKVLHAIQIYQSLIEEFPEIPESYIQLSNIFQSTGKTKSAENIIRSIYELQPDNYELTLYYSQLLMQNESWDKAVKLLLDLIEGDPFAEYLTGYCYYKKKEFELAKVHFLKFVKSGEEPELVHEAYFILAKIEYELEHYEDALKHAKKAELIFNDDWELYLVYAKIYYKFSMYTHSYDSIKKGFKINDNISILHKWAGKVNLKLNNFTSAKEHLQKYIDIKGKVTSDDYSLLAETCILCDDLNNALLYFNLALNSNPENKLAIKGRAKIIKMIGDNAASDF